LPVRPSIHQVEPPTTTTTNSTPGIKNLAVVETVDSVKLADRLNKVGDKDKTQPTTHQIRQHKHRGQITAIRLLCMVDGPQSP
jgi:hypothetical protein